MIHRFIVDGNGFSPFERERVKRAIIDQGRRQGLKMRVITDGGKFRCSAEGEPLYALAYEAAILSWFNLYPAHLRL